MDERWRVELLERCYQSNQTGEESPSYWIVFESKTRLASALDDFVFRYYHLSLVIAVGYGLATILVLYAMKTRKAFKMKKFSLWWYATLCVLNTLTLARMIPHMLFTNERKGFYVSLCTDKTFVCDVVSAFWAMLFPYLKVLELGDIFVLALQKRSVTLFVWTHHLLALLASWHMYPYYPAIGLWYIVTISLPHILIYVYLFFKELNFRMSKAIPASILSIELITQCLGSVISILALIFVISGRSCTLSLDFIVLINVIWIVCVILCTQYLYHQCKKYWGTGTQNMITRL